MRAGSGPAAQAGFTYLGLLLAVALAGTALAAAGTLWSTQAKRNKEEELLFAGRQIRSAIAAYWEQVPAGQPHVYPRSLQDLLEDKRWPTVRRHLRKVYVEPFDPSHTWGLIDAPSGGVMGVFSLSEGVPLKKALFPTEQADFEKARSYRDWRFVYTPAAAASSPRP